MTELDPELGPALPLLVFIIVENDLTESKYLLSLNVHEIRKVLRKIYAYL